MPPVAADEFAALLRDLDPDAQLRFVADVWAARGWETTVENDRVVAERDDRRVTVTVASPPRFGRPTVPATDVAVTTRADDDFAAAAEEAGVAYVPPDDLLTRLLYGVDRDRAEAVFQDYFDRPLTVEGSAYGGGSSLATGGSRVPWRLVVAVGLLLLVGAAVAFPGSLSLGGGGEPGATDRVTPVDVGTATAEPSSYPPGISAAGITNVSRLATAHRDSLLGREYRWHVAARGVASAPGMDNRTAWNYTVRVENPTHYYFQGTFVEATPEGGRELNRVAIYAEGGPAYRRSVEGDVTAYRRYPIETAGDASLYANEARRLLLRYLATDESRVVCTPDHPSGNCSSFLVVATGTPAAFDREVRDYRAEAAVTSAGRVSRLHVRYAVPNYENGTLALVEFGFVYDRFGEVQIERPPWLDEAQTETGPTERATPTTSGTATATRTVTETPTSTP